MSWHADIESLKQIIPTQNYDVLIEKVRRVEQQAEWYPKFKLDITFEDQYCYIDFITPPSPEEVDVPYMCLLYLNTGEWAWSTFDREEDEYLCNYDVQTFRNNKPGMRSTYVLYDGDDEEDSDDSEENLVDNSNNHDGRNRTEMHNAKSFEELLEDCSRHVMGYYNMWRTFCFTPGFDCNFSEIFKSKNK